MVKIVWTDLSASDIKEIFEYIAEDSFRYASITVNKIYQSIQPIAENPYIGKMVPEYRQKTIRELIEGNYRIIYRIKNKNQIDILRIYHRARLLRRKSIK